MNKKEEQIKLGLKIKELRVSKGLTQFDLGVKVNKDQQSIQRLEAGRINPSYLYLLEICEGLEVEIKDVFSF